MRREGGVEPGVLGGLEGRAGRGGEVEVGEGVGRADGGGGGGLEGEEVAGGGAPVGHSDSVLVEVGRGTGGWGDVLVAREDVEDGGRRGVEGRAVVDDGAGAGRHVSVEDVEHDPGGRRVLHDDARGGEGVVQEGDLFELQDVALLVDDAFGWPAGAAGVDNDHGVVERKSRVL